MTELKEPEKIEKKPNTKTKPKFTLENPRVTISSTSNQSLTPKEFLEWHEKLHKYNVGEYRSYKPANIADFSDSVNKKHEGIRSFLNGISKTFKIEFTDNALPLADDVIKLYMPTLRFTIPEYFDHHQLKDEDFRYRVIPKIGIDFSKHINNYLRTKKVKDKISPYNIQVLRNNLANFGDKYADSTFKAGENPHYLTFSTDPRAFAMIGNYTADSQCCFNAYPKFCFGDHEDTFISIFHQNEKFDYDYKASPNKMGRNLGIMSDNYQTINISNRYGKLSKISSIFENISNLILLDSKNGELKTLFNNHNFSGGVPYTNKDGISFTKLASIGFFTANFGNNYSVPFTN